jgi:hypothetical protein
MALRQHNCDRSLMRFLSAVKSGRRYLFLRDS